MRKPGFAVLASAVAIAVVSLAANPAAAFPGEPLGPEWRVDDVGGQSAIPALAMAEDGRNLIVYLSELADGSAAIPARYEYGPDEVQPQSGTLFLAQDGTVRTEPDVAMSKYGLFLAVWERRSADGLDLGIHGRFHDRFLGPMGDEIALGDVTAVMSRNPAVATDAYGLRYAIAWTSEEAGVQRLRTRAFGSDMSPLGASLVLPADDATATFVPSVASTHDRGYYVAWRDSRVADGVRYESVRVQRVQDGALSGAPVLVTEIATPFTDQIGPQVAIAAREAGEFVVVWESFGEVLARRFDADGIPLGPEALVSGSTHAAPSPHVAMDSDGGFVVTWQSVGEGNAIHARAFGADGLPHSDPVRIDATAGANRFAPRVGTDADGDAIVTWTHQAEYGAPMEVHARRLRGNGTVDLSLNTFSLTYSAAPGDIVGLQLDAYNASMWPEWTREGAATASGVQLSAALPSGVSLLEAFGDGWLCDAAGACSHDRLVAPQSSVAPLHLTLRAPEQPGSYTLDMTIGSHQLDGSPADNSLSVVLDVADLEPDPFAFAEIVGAPRSSWVVSEAVVVSGISDPVQVSVTGGEYSIDGGAFTASPGQVEAGQAIRVRHLSSADFATRTESQLTVGPANAVFASTTEIEDASPDAIAFNDVVDAVRRQTVMSDPLVPIGFNTPVTIAVSGGSWSRNGGAFQSSPGTIAPGDVVRLQVLSSHKRYTTVQMQVTIGDSADTWSVTTGR